VQASTTLRQEGQSLTCSSEVDLRGPHSDASVKQLYSKFGFNSLKNTFLQLCWRIRFACLIYRHRREALRAGTQQFTNWRRGINLSISLYVRTCAIRFVHRGQTFHTMHFHLNVIRSFSGSAELTPSLFMGNHVQSGLLTEANQVCSPTSNTMDSHLRVMRFLSGSTDGSPNAFLLDLHTSVPGVTLRR